MNNSTPKWRSPRKETIEFLKKMARQYPVQTSESGKEKGISNIQHQYNVTIC